jgi:hypothetical protein
VIQPADYKHNKAENDGEQDNCTANVLQIKNSEKV